MPTRQPPKYEPPPLQTSVLLDEYSAQLFPMIWQITGKMTISATIRYAIIQTGEKAERELKRRKRKNAKI